jgi:tetratricopeptide (TPR) repeat protein
LSAAAKKTDGVTMVTAVLNPYALIGFELGSYYNEIGKSEDAIRVLDETLSLSPSPDGAVGAHVGELMNEKGVALGSLKRNSEALDIFEQALASHVLTAHDRALLDRGRGYTLTELNRLDEAEAAFRDSLQYEPGNKRAETELGYIAHLRAGGAQAPRELFSTPPQKPQ